MFFEPRAWNLSKEVEAALGGKPPLVIDIFGEINNEMIDPRLERLYSIRPDQSLLLLINSPGGAMGGLKLAAAIHQLKMPVVALAIGAVYSMALSIYLSVPKKHRFALKGATFLAHCRRGGFDLAGVIDLEQGKIRNLTKAETMRLVGLVWDDMMKFEKELIKELTHAIGDPITLGGESVSIEELLRYEVPLSAGIAKRLGLVHRVVGGLAQVCSG